MKALLGTLLLLSTVTVNAETAVEAIAAHKHMGVATVLRFDDREPVFDIRWEAIVD